MHREERLASGTPYGKPASVNAEPLLRRATDADADAVADVYLRARHHAVPDIPPLASCCQLLG
jgi:hypothetical protein